MYVINRPPLQLKKDQDRRLRFGHCWVYSNEVDVERTPLKAFEAGQAVDIVDSRGKWLGSGYVNPHTLLCARLVSRDAEHPLDRSLLVHRLKIALALRERFFPKPYYRLLYGESDGLPGLVVDRYGQVLVVQITTAGMECMKQDIVAALDKVLQPDSILLRNDAQVREIEQLERYQELTKGKMPEYLEVEEADSRFRVSPGHGQKTGWFFDQAFNRRRLAAYAGGRRVLDVCSYVGAWGVEAAVRGAAEVCCIDTSSAALDGVRENAMLNSVDQRITTLHGDAFEKLRELRAAKERFDLVLVDPPAFVKRRKDLKQGSLAYRRLNQMAMQLLARDGTLISSSCSHHMSGERLLQTLQQAGRHLDRVLQLLEQGSQAPDHPIHPAIPETAYLKTFYLRVLPSF